MSGNETVVALNKLVIGFRGCSVTFGGGSGIQVYSVNLGTELEEDGKENSEDLSNEPKVPKDE